MMQCSSMVMLCRCCGRKGNVSGKAAAAHDAAAAFFMVAAAIAAAVYHHCCDCFCCYG